MGLGAIGGSVAKAVMARSPGTPVYGVDPDPESAGGAARDGIRVARRLGDCDVDGGVVVFAAPLDATARLVRGARPIWSGAALATDVASLKAPVLAAAGGAGNFVGAHPMCGTERSGYGASRADLFEGATVWLCGPSGGGSTATGGGAPATGPAPAALAAAFWSLLGGVPTATTASRHDRLMARVSHLPQLLATALAAALEDAGVTPSQMGPGARGMTRLAASSPAMWTPLLAAAAAADADALGALERQAAAIRRMLEAGDVDAIGKIMTRGREWLATT